MKIPEHPEIRMPSERGKKFAEELLSLCISGGSEQDQIDYVANLFDVYAGKTEEEAEKDPLFCNDCCEIYYKCWCEPKLEQIPSKAEGWNHDDPDCPCMVCTNRRRG